MEIYLLIARSEPVQPHARTGAVQCTRYNNKKRLLFIGTIRKKMLMFTHVVGSVDSRYFVHFVNI